MKIIFMGTAEFAVPPLRACSSHVCLVVTQPDRPSGRGHKLKASPVKQAALELGLPVETPEKARDPEFVATLRRFDADFLLVAAYGQILSESVLQSAKNGGINLHGSILPEYRGAAPIQRCLADGRHETGVTLMQMDKGMDTGDIIHIDKLRIQPGETYGQLQERLAEVAANMTSAWLERLTTGQYPRTPQNNALATYAPKITKEEAEIKASMTAETAHNHFRGFTPNPGAWMQTLAGPAKLLGCQVADESGEPGTVLQTQPELVIAMAQQSLVITQLQPAGKPAMSGRDFANGQRLKVGDRFFVQAGITNL